MRWRPTVQGWPNLVLSIMGIVVLGGAVGGAWLMNRTDGVMAELLDKIQPARVAAYQLQAAVRDQETALRGYLITGDRQFLDPFFAGQDAERAAAQEIRELVPDHPDSMADLDAVESATSAWRTSYAEPLIARVQSGGPTAVVEAETERGKTLFDGLRRVFDTQNEHFVVSRDDAVAELDRVQAWRDGVLIAMVAAFLVAAVLSALVVRNAVNRPLAALAASCRRITEGNFDERIEPSGPRDIRAIASDVEDMRQRIVDELASSRSARAQLADQALELQRSNAELEQFAYVASHDLQEPLRKVASFCQLLEKRYGDKLDERGAEYIGFAVDGAKRMQVLINDLLTFSRVGRLNAELVDVDLGDVLDNALSNLDTAITETDAEIVREGQPLPVVKGDPTLLTMLWQNLIGNAVKFRREGLRPRVVITCEEDSGNWLFAVTDNGIGIPAEFVDKVFVIFQRLHGRDVYTGTGIGLAICKKIVEHHGGSIWIDSTYTEGTRFRFTVPAVLNEHVPADLEGSTV